MKQELTSFLEVFLSCDTNEQVQVMAEIKAKWKDQLTNQGEQTEKRLVYLKDVFKAEFPNL